MTGYVSKKMLGAARLPDTPTARAYLQKVLDNDDDDTQVYKKPWVDLTDEEIEGAIDDGFAFGLNDGNVSNEYVIRYARAIGAMLKEKNYG